MQHVSLQFKFVAYVYLTSFTAMIEYSLENLSELLEAISS